MSNSAAAGAPSSERIIENLIAAYAELIDDGHFVELGDLLADATFTFNGGVPARGRDAVVKQLTDTTMVHEDGTPRTRHLVTNVIIEIDEEAGTALSRSYFTALQALPDFPLQPVVSGRCRDRFERRDGQWRFVERQVTADFFGDVSHHIRPGAGQ
jgi:3-phenylpropionate/cinnamic acid dioxygenase small subunit